MNFNTLMWDREGALTRRLVQEPGPFGLGKIPAATRPDAITSMVCGFCSTGCSLDIHLKDGQAIGLTPDHMYPVNQGMACPKGWEALSVMDSKDRGVTPLALAARGRAPRPVDWKEAAALFTRNFKRIQALHGPESVAFISTGQLVVEEMALLGAVAKFGMGMVHGDGNTRQCMATAVTAYKQSFGFDAPPYTYADFEASDTLVFVGANPCIAHPIMWERVMMNPHNPDIIVVDPRRTETAMAATLHVPLQPKSDLCLFYGLAKGLIDRGAVDTTFIDSHTKSFSAFAEFVSDFTLERVVEETGLPEEMIQTLIEKIASGKRVSFWWTMGVNQSHEGTRIAQAIINLALMTGNIGRPGTGANSITGQCNAMGSRLFSNTTNLLGGRSFTSAEDRADVAETLELEEGCIPDRDSLPYHRILEEVERGTIKGLWIICTNPGHSWIEQPRFRALVDKLEYLVVQDLYHSTETAQLADLYLPAAGWGEKEGTFINSERRFGLVKRVRQAPGEALADFWIIKLLAEAWGCGNLFRKWESPEAVFQILKQLSAGRPCDITGIEDYQMLDRFGGVQWPCAHPAAAVVKERRLFEDGKFYHPDGRARFLFEAPRPVAEPVCDAYPFTLLTGRGSAAQWHTQTRTSKSAILRKLYPNDPYVEVHPDDARRLAWRAHQWVDVSSRRATVRVRAFITPCVQPGQLFIAMHYPEANQLTHSDFDPYSHQPCYKSAAVRGIAG